MPEKSPMVTKLCIKVSDVSPVAGQKNRWVSWKEKHNRSFQILQRKKILNNVCDLDDLCGEILLGDCI
jgi:hypothetical protein